MKKVFATLFLTAMLVTSVFAWNEGKTIQDVGIPYRVSHIEFWNGGSCIAKIDNATVEIIVEKNKTLLSLTNDTNEIQFYVYKVTSSGKTVYIVDSESLAIIFTK